MVTGKPLASWVYVQEEELKSKKGFAYWLNLALAFNAKAKASKKKK